MVTLVDAPSIYASVSRGTDVHCPVAHVEMPILGMNNAAEGLVG